MLSLFSTKGPFTYYVSKILQIFYPSLHSVSKFTHSYSVEITLASAIWYGKLVNEACIDDCTGFGFPLFKDCVHDPVPRTTTSIAAGYSEYENEENSDTTCETVDDMEDEE